MSRFGVVPSVWGINGFFLDPLFCNQTEKSIIRERWSQETFWGKGQSAHLFFFMGKKVGLLVLLCFSCHERLSYLTIYPSSKYQKVKQVPWRAQNFSRGSSLKAEQCLTCRVAPGLNSDNHKVMSYTWPPGYDPVRQHSSAFNPVSEGKFLATPDWWSLDWKSQQSGNC